MVAFPHPTSSIITGAHAMNLDLPIRSGSKRNEESRNTPQSSVEAVWAVIKDVPPVNDRLIVGVDFGTTYSG